jgi:hypothetical protein
LDKKGRLAVDVTVFFNNLTPQERLVFIILLFQGVFMVILAIAGIRLKKLLNRYRQLLTGSSQNNLEGLLLDLGERMKNAEVIIRNNEEEIRKIEDESFAYLQRWALHRYKAFSNIGGDQSFSLVLLDKKGDGVLLSSIYGRDESRTYAKSIKGGKSNYPLSDEEQEVLAGAIQKK